MKPSTSSAPICTEARVALIDSVMVITIPFSEVGVPTFLALSNYYSFGRFLHFLNKPMNLNN
jgi:hypothetical protein